MCHLKSNGYKGQCPSERSTMASVQNYNNKMSIQFDNKTFVKITCTDLIWAEE